MRKHAPDKAFVKAGTFGATLAALRKLCGLSVPEGLVADLPAGGKDVELDPAVTIKPFSASYDGTGLLLERGMVSFAGSILYFPAARYPCPAGSTVSLRVVAKFTTVNNNPNPWTLKIDDASAADLPSLVVHLTSSVGYHGIISNPAAETIVVTDGVIYIPIASWTGSRVIQHQHASFSVTFRSNGSALVSGRWSN